MKTTVNERITQIISQFGYKSKRSFAEKIGIAQTSLNDILRGAEPKYSTLYKILEAEPLVSSEWLLRGEGEMLKSQPTSLDLESKTNKTSAPHQIETKNINIDLRGEQIDSKRTIEVFIKVIETYQTRMDDLLNVIEVLKNENTDLKEQLEKPNVS